MQRTKQQNKTGYAACGRPRASPQTTLCKGSRLRKDAASVILAEESPPEEVELQLQKSTQQRTKAIELKSLLHVDVDPTSNNVCANLQASRYESRLSQQNTVTALKGHA